MAVMMNTLGRRAQTQSDTPQTTEQGEAIPKEKVIKIHRVIKLRAQSSEL